jgi:hypothetical protein
MKQERTMADEQRTADQEREEIEEIEDLEVTDGDEAAAIQGGYEPKGGKYGPGGGE